MKTGKPASRAVSAPAGEGRRWRLIARPFALLLIPIDQLWGRRAILLVLAAVTILFTVADVIRILTRHEVSAVYRPGEASRLSSMTWFLAAAFLGFLVFPGEIPSLALCFTTIGDACGKLAGRRFGRHHLNGSHTVEGSAAFLGGALAASLILSLFVHAPLLFVIGGSLFATVVELFSEGLEDNFSVPLLSGGFLYALRYFGAA